MSRPRKLPEVKELAKGSTFRERGYRYAVDFRDIDDKRVLKVFKHGEKETAETYAEVERLKIKNHGTETAAILNDAALREAAACIRQLEAVGKTLTDATTHFLAHLATNESSVSIDELIAIVIETKRREKKSARYLSDLESRLGRFCRDFTGRQVASLTSDEISAWLNGLMLEPVGQNNYRRLLVLAFNVGLKRKVCRFNPAAESDKVKEIECDVAILTPDEAARLLSVAGPEILPSIALGLFAGLRRSELESLAWEDVDFIQNHVLIRAEKAKSARKRFVPLSENLVAWLKPFAQPGGPVVSQGYGFRKGFDDARAAAGLLKSWSGNELRHSFASYHLAENQDAGTTSQALGHTSPNIVFRHYRKLVTPDAARRFWSIAPNHSENVVELKTA